MKLSPKTSLMNVDSSSLSLTLPDIGFIIEEEQKTQKSPITVYKPKAKSNSNELF